MPSVNQEHIPRVRFAVTIFLSELKKTNVFKMTESRMGEDRRQNRKSLVDSSEISIPFALWLYFTFIESFVPRLELVLRAKGIL